MHSQAAPACFSIRIEALPRTEVLLTAATLLAMWQCLFGRNRLVRYQETKRTDEEAMKIADTSETTSRVGGAEDE